MQATVLQGRQLHALIASLLFANFVIGSGVMAVPGILNLLADDLRVSVPIAGQLISLSAIVISIGAPVTAALTYRFDRRLLLTAAMLLYALGHLVCALMPSFAPLLPIRAISVISAAVVTPQAAATVGLVVPADKRSGAVTGIFLGWSLASVVGIPLASLIGTHFGWRTTFLCISGLSVLATLALALTVPKGLSLPPMSFQTWRRVLTHPQLMTVLAVTLISASGQFTVFAYVAPALRHSVGAEGATLAFLLGWNGAFGVLGNVYITRRIGRWGPDRAVRRMLTSMVLAQLTWGLAMLLPHLAWPILLGALSLWGIGIFASNSSQQARLMAVDPGLASASIALNTSAIYGGQAIGAVTGALILNWGDITWLPWVAAVVLMVALVVSRRVRINP